MEKKFWPIFWKVLLIIWLIFPGFFLFKSSLESGLGIWNSIQAASIVVIPWTLFSLGVFFIYKIVLFIRKQSEKAQVAELADEIQKVEKEQLENERLEQEVKKEKLEVSNKLFGFLNKIFK